MSIAKERKLPIREKRDGTIAAYAGSLGALQAEGKERGLTPRVRTFAQDTKSDLQAALELLSTMKDLAIVVHGPAGCFSGLTNAERSLVTGIEERDSILGGDKKLRATLRKAILEFKPRAIAVVGSPVAAINNDDADAVVAEVREELELPVFFVRADAFKSKVAVNGRDLVVHALLREIASQRGQAAAESYVTLLSLKEGSADAHALADLLAPLGVRVDVFPRFSRPSDWSKVRASKATIAIDPSDADLLGQAITEDFGIPYVTGVAPVGFRNTTAWLAKVGSVLGKTAEVAEIGERARASLDSWKQAFGRHQGVRVYLSGPPGVALALIDLVEELGLAVAGVTLTYAESRHQSQIDELSQRHPGLPVLVGQGQAFEEANLLHRIGANLYVGLESSVEHALRLGIPTLDLTGVPYLGFCGAVRFAEAAYRRLENQGLAKFLAEGDGPYSPQWFAKSTHWFIKHEVK